MLTVRRRSRPTTQLIRRRIEQAIAFRESLAIDATAYRLVHGEADLLPSLVVDRYGDYLVVQALSQGMDRLLPLVVATLGDLVAPRGILARNDPRARLLEGLEQRVDVLAGDVPESVGVVESGIEYDVDLRRGQKTGLFLDQRENREAAAGYARGRLLDCFSYNGGFALKLARPLPGDDRDRHLRGRRRARAGERRTERPRDRRARRQRVRRAARPRAAGRALRHDRARPARVREEQGGGRRRRPRATRRSTCAR